MTRTDDYDYELPKELIAQHPLATRTDARLLVVDRAQQSLTHAHIRDLPDFLRPSDALVLNDTKVLPARLKGYRLSTRGRWQGLYLSSDHGLWRILGKTRGRLQEGEQVVLEDREGRDAFPLTMVRRLDKGEWVAKPEVDGSFVDLLERVGRVPLPGYIRSGEMTDADSAAYQTVFARTPGAVAAPTAGLHFTPALLQRIAQLGVAIQHVTLHVGIGTFRPVQTDNLDEHPMHTEWASAPAETVRALQERRNQGGRVVAVGTTVVRTLESAARGGSLEAWAGETDLFIRPPYAFRAVDVLLTNFHLPRSTLLVLVRTFGGDGLMQRAYAAAIEERYRFYSYGDAMLIV